MRPKVAFIVSKFPCYDEAFILRELRSLSEKMEIVIFSLRKSDEKIVHDEARELLSKTVYIPYFFSWKICMAHLETLWTWPGRYLTALIRLIFGNLKSPEFLAKSLAFFPKSVYVAKALRKEGVTHIHAYWATYPASVALAVSRITQVPFSFTGHAHDIYLDTTHLREKMRYARFVTTCTRANKDYLMKINPGCPSDKILVQYHGLRLEQFAVNGKIRNQTFQILSVGTLQDHKGFNYLLDAVKILEDRGLDFACTIIGGGPLEEDLRTHIRLLKINHRVTLTGPLKQNDVIPYYKKADALVLMAQSEWHWGIPNVLIEALAAKTPVVTTRFGSVEELVKDGESGILVEAKNAEGLAKALEKLYHDEAFRQRITRAGYEFVLKHFDLEKNLEAFMHKVPSPLQGDTP